MKNQLRNLTLLFSVTALFLFASCEQPASTPVDWGSAPPAEYIGTWEKIDTTPGASSETKLTIDTSGKVSLYSKSDITLLMPIMVAIAQLKQPGITEAELWAQMQEPNSDSNQDTSTGLFSSASVTYSSSSPYIITERATAKYEDLKDSLSVSTDGTKLTMTTKAKDGSKNTVILTKK